MFNEWIEKWNLIVFILTFLQEQLKSKIVEQKKKEKAEEAKNPSPSLVDKVDTSSSALDRFSKKKGTK